ncbi:MAG TPA: hypothetical protein VLT45_07790 [Kofleriaceae bacterium]|nr:hypothetical protein [Kofleriaceae bacterium]
MDFYPAKTGLAEERRYRVGLTGTGAAIPTVRAGVGFTMSRTGAGVYRITFNDNPGTFVGVEAPFLRADAPAAVKNMSVTAGAYVAPAAGADGYIELSVWSSGGIATDLAAAQYIDTTVIFAAQSRIK